MWNSEVTRWMRGNNSPSRPPVPIFTSDKSSICISTIYDRDPASHSTRGIWLITGTQRSEADITYWSREEPFGWKYRCRKYRQSHRDGNTDISDCYCNCQNSFSKLAKIRRFVSRVHFAKVHFRKYSLEIEVSKLLLLVIAFGKDITYRGQWTLCNGRTDIPITSPGQVLCI